MGLVINGDALEELKQLEPESVDLILTDPPYLNMLDNSSIVKRNIKGRGFCWDMTEEKLLKIYAELFRVLKNNGHLISFGDFKTIETLNRTFPSKVGQIAYYIKPLSSNPLSANMMLMPCVELIGIYSNPNDRQEHTEKMREFLTTMKEHAKEYREQYKDHMFSHYTSLSLQVAKIPEDKYQDFFQRFTDWTYQEYVEEWKKKKKKKKTFNGHNTKNCFFVKNFHRIHPNEKDKEILKTLIDIYSNPGDVVLDCFAGSGSTGVACKETDRDYILIEENQEYFEMIERQL